MCLPSAHPARRGIATCHECCAAHYSSRLLSIHSPLYIQSVVVTSSIRCPMPFLPFTSTANFLVNQAPLSFFVLLPSAFSLLSHFTLHFTLPFFFSLQLRYIHSTPGSKKIPSPPASASASASSASQSHVIPSFLRFSFPIATSLRIASCLLAFLTSYDLFLTCHVSSFPISVPIRQCFVSSSLAHANSKPVSHSFQLLSPICLFFFCFFSGPHVLHTRGVPTLSVFSAAEMYFPARLSSQRTPFIALFFFYFDYIHCQCMNSNFSVSVSLALSNHIHSTCNKCIVQSHPN